MKYKDKIYKCHLLNQSICKITRRKLSNVFLQIFSNKTKARTVFFAIKVLNQIFTNIKGNNAKFTLNKLRENKC